MSRAKFIPPSDPEFTTFALNYARVMGNNPDVYRAAPEEVQAIRDAVAAFEHALAEQSRPMHRSKATRMRKDETRATAQGLIEDSANRIRPDRSIDVAAKALLGIKVRSEKRRPRRCPQTRPRLRLVASKSGTWNQPGCHRLMFFDREATKTSNAKPEGATRIEVQRDFLQPGQPIPEPPDQRKGNPAEFVGSFMRSPVTVQYSAVPGATRVVYWARWGGSRNHDVGPYGHPLVLSLDTWVEGPALPGPKHAGELEVEQRVTVTTRPPKQLPEPEAA